MNEYFDYSLKKVYSVGDDLNTISETPILKPYKIIYELVITLPSTSRNKDFSEYARSMTSLGSIMERLNTFDTKLLHSTYSDNIERTITKLRVMGDTQTPVLSESDVAPFIDTVLDCGAERVQIDWIVLLIKKNDKLQNLIDSYSEYDANDYFCNIPIKVSNKLEGYFLVGNTVRDREPCYTFRIVKEKHERVQDPEHYNNAMVADTRLFRELYLKRESER